MNWFDIVKQQDDPANVKAIMYSGRDGYSVSKYNKGWADILMRAIVQNHGPEKDQFYDSTPRNDNTPEVDSGLKFMGIPIIANVGNIRYRGNGWAELKQPLPEEGIALVNDIRQLNEQLNREMQLDKPFYAACLGQFPTELQQHKQRLSEEVDRQGSWVGRNLRRKRA